MLNVLQALGLRPYPLARGQESDVQVRHGETGWKGGFALPLTDLYVVSGDSTSYSARRASDYR
ncbi:MAG: hypothetical protein OXC26_25940 [Albidovulum sp.]|nr:hypothetical protein [Albidovulum sp.]